MVDKSAVGATDDPFTMTIERGKVREFARATMSCGPDYLDNPIPVIPPTFLMAVAFWRPRGRVGVLQGQDGSAPVAARRPGVHLPRAATCGGDRAHVQSRVADIYEKEGKRGGTMTFVVMVTEFRDEQRQARGRGRVRPLIETGKGAEGRCVMTSWDELHVGTRARAARVRPAHPDRLRAVPGRIG